MSERPHGAESLLRGFREELLRWNRQINLVSRQETDDRLDGLFKQCVGGEEAVLAWLRNSGWEARAQNGLFYFDLGSGGGLPGLVWHILFGEVFGGVRSFMVEPRQKRAWFLKRQNQISGMPAFEALRGRWGEVCVADPAENTGLNSQQLIVVSLKALHLDDILVLKGLNVAFSSHPGLLSEKCILLARYYPPKQQFDSDLASKLKIPDSGHLLALGDYIYKGRGGEILSMGPSGSGLASLVVSSYEAQDSR